MEATPSLAALDASIIVLCARRVASGLFFMCVQDSAHRWVRKEDVWRTQLRDADERLRAAQEQCRAERDRVSCAQSVHVCVLLFFCGIEVPDTRHL